MAGAYGRHESISVRDPVLFSVSASPHLPPPTPPLPSNSTRQESPSTLRGLYGTSDTRNATHGSDSEASVRRELAVFFPETRFEQLLAAAAASLAQTAAIESPGNGL